ncbi:MAG: DUF4974 domain-containing protein [Tannerellaceae bacterium]|nr:DUF4974 domain-containing protein [Tannerellaceae bacterium]
MEVVAVPGTKTRLVLPDSSIVWLNGSATIRYPQVFTGNERAVEFMGEGLFEVTENREQPFVVNVEGMRIQVLGTLFNVWADADSDYVETTLLDGSVALFLGKNHTSVADHILGINQQAVFNRKSQLLEVKDVSAQTYSSWVTHQFHFEDQTMEEIAHLLERAFGVKIYIQSDTIRNMRLNARFTQQESVEEILSILQIPAHYTYQKKQGAFYIR